MPPESCDNTDMETEEVVINCTWKTRHRVIVPKGWQAPSYLDDFPEYVLNALTTVDAEITDWNAYRR